MVIITPEDWREYIGAKRPDIDEKVEFMIPAANALITAALGISSESSGQDLLDVRPTRTKYFLSSPTATVNTIERVSGIGSVPSWSVYSGTIIFAAGPEEGTLLISYDDAGLGTIGQDLKMAGCMLVEHWRDKEYRVNKTFGGETVQFNSTKSGIPEHIRTIIELYRRL
ncbi:MAG: hypothetical protein [Bacteriophage sp.]|nr:MAG: hypothetical protein [Bacteriophage sp.]